MATFGGSLPPISYSEWNSIGCSPSTPMSTSLNYPSIFIGQQLPQAQIHSSHTLNIHILIALIEETLRDISSSLRQNCNAAGKEIKTQRLSSVESLGQVTSMLQGWRSKIDAMRQAGVQQVMEKAQSLRSRKAALNDLKNVMEENESAWKQKVDTFFAELAQHVERKFDEQRAKIKRNLPLHTTGQQQAQHCADYQLHNKGGNCNKNTQSAELSKATVSKTRIMAAATISQETHSTDNSSLSGAANSSKTDNRKRRQSASGKLKTKSAKRLRN